MKMPSAEEMAKTAYEAYGQETNHKNYRGEPMPEWDELPEQIKGAWIQAAGSVVRTMLEASRVAGMR